MSESFDDMMDLQDDVAMNFKPVFPYHMMDAKKEVELSIGIKDRILYIAFLGSVSKMDWIHNFMIWKIPYKRMKKLFFVHAGFLRIYRINQEFIHLVLDRNRGTFDAVYINGHSLGGAVAEICHEDMVFLKEEGLLDMGDKTIHTVTSGAPRAFGAFFSSVPRRRCRNLIRVRYHNDGVPCLPPAILGYRHVGMEKQYGKPSLFGWCLPSAVYHHGVRSYRNLTGSDVDEKLKALATKIYKYVYLGILACIVAVVIFFIMTGGI
jgi:hypothetical protein